MRRLNPTALVPPLRASGALDGPSNARIYHRHLMSGCAVTVAHVTIVCASAAGVGHGHVWRVEVGVPRDDVSHEYWVP